MHNYERPHDKIKTQFVSSTENIDSGHFELFEKESTKLRSLYGRNWFSVWIQSWASVWYLWSKPFRIVSRKQSFQIFSITLTIAPQLFRASIKSDRLVDTDRNSSILIIYDFYCRSKRFKCDSIKKNVVQIKSIHQKTVRLFCLPCKYYPCSNSYNNYISSSCLRVLFIFSVEHFKNTQPINDAWYKIKWARKKQQKNDLTKKNRFVIFITSVYACASSRDQAYI